LGFECGYAAANPLALVIWEAQYGDFVNGAQVIIDQFISSGYQKWNRLCGLVMFLPHGHEGAGPEHTSARLERFLQLCAQDNIQVFVPTTPAQIFHLLRRQILRPVRTTLVVMTPKSLLRHKLAVSTFEDLSHGQLQLVIPEMDEHDKNKITRIILCSGKVYYDLLTKRRELQQQHVAIIRIEQLYPFPHDILQTILAEYTQVNEFIWCQEEPKNQGAWFSTRHRIETCLPVGKSLHYVGRPSMAAPAVGYTARHQKEQNALVDEALGK
jgi:2-oxoglutarate dehydrogenase E1 component